MQTPLSTVALRCLKIGGASYLLSWPLGSISLAAGEATYAGSLATVLIAGAVFNAADKREMARLAASAKQALAQARTADRPDPAGDIVLGGGSIVIHRGGAHISY
jgi:hypothetical protein